MALDVVSDTAAPLYPATKKRPRMQLRSSAQGVRVWKITTGVAAIGIAVIMLLPIVWMVLTAFKPESDVVAFPPSLLPRAFSLQAFVDVWQEIPFAKLYLNTIIFSASVTIISLTLDSLTAYALARFDFKGKNVVFIAILVLLMLPSQITLIPLYDMLSTFGLTNSLTGMILPRITGAFGIFFMRQFFLSIPKDLEEAGRIDGAGPFRIYVQIIMPIAKPALLTLGLFCFQGCWNDLLWPLIMAPNIESATIPAGLSLFAGQHTVSYALMMAGAALSLIPVVVFFLIVQKSFVQGIATSGLKG